ncbi:hypothetical protein V5799_020370 [Amblyomma americanum]|uniref:Uncharacterized protein n=1 Tax=Amblyomma americanum TaxID=6943 RepID=A0AAQ4EUM9_AMBAM
MSHRIRCICKKQGLPLLVEALPLHRIQTKLAVQNRTTETKWRWLTVPWGLLNARLPPPPLFLSSRLPAFPLLLLHPHWGTGVPQRFAAVRASGPLDGCSRRLIQRTRGTSALTEKGGAVPQAAGVLDRGRHRRATKEENGD